MPQVQVIQPIQQHPKRRRVAAYARVSSKATNQLNSMSGQVEYYTDLIQKNPNWEFVGVYADEGVSGTSLKNRTGFNHLMDDCRLGLIDRILVKSSSRMARNSLDFLSAVRELKSLGVVVEFEKERFDTDSTEGELLLGMMCAVAQEESLSISKNLRWGICKRMESGTYHTSSAPYGYKQVNYDLVPIPGQIEIAKDIFNAFLQGKSTSKIADDLNRLRPRLCLPAMFPASRPPAWYWKNSIKNRLSPPICTWAKAQAQWPACRCGIWPLRSTTAAIRLPRAASRRTPRNADAGHRRRG